MERLGKAIKNLGGLKSESKGFTGIQLAEVNSVDPLTVIFQGIELGSEDIKIADYLLKDYEREFDFESDNTANLKGSKFTLNGATLLNDTTPGGTRPITTIPEAGAVTNIETEGTLKAKGKIKWTDTLKKGDELAVLLTEDEQTLIILCKVVSI